MWMSMKPGASMPPSRSTARQCLGTSRRARDVTSAMIPSSTRSSGCSMRSSGVNKAVAVIAIMNDWIVSDSSFYRKNPDDLAAAGRPCSAGVSAAVRWASPLRAGSARAICSAAEGARPSGAKATTGVLYFLAESNAGASAFGWRGSASVDLVGAWLSLVEHLVRDQGVGGSNPLAPTNFFRKLGRGDLPPKVRESADTRQEVTA